MRRSFEAVLSLALVMTLIASGAEPGTPLPAGNVGPETLLLERHSGQISTLAFSPDGRLLASGGSAQTIRLWGLGTGRELKILRGHSGSVLGLAFAANGQWLASASADGTIRLWDPMQGREVKALTGRFGAFRAVVFSPDGQQVVSAGDDSLKVQEATGQNQHPMKKGEVEEQLVLGRTR
jgi:WD40 repeat protein